MTDEAKPLINSDLVDAAAALLLCQHDSPLVGSVLPPNRAEDAYFYGEEDLMAARTAASAYLVAVFNAALEWNKEDE